MVKLHKLKQEKFHLTISPFEKPELTIMPGDSAVIYLEDALGGKVKTEKDKLPSRYNPCSGPIYVKGAEKGDTLVIGIDDIKIAEEEGVSYIMVDTDQLSDFLLSPRMEPKITRVADGWVFFPNNVKVPTKPNIGCIGTALEDEVIATDYAGKHGGNMDNPDVCVGNKLFLPVNVSGGLLYVGDVHAVSGAGELNCVDIAAEVTLMVNLIKSKRINWPRVESTEYIETVSTAGSIKDAMKICLKELVLWLEEEYQMDRWNAYLLCTQVATIQTPKIVHPAPTVTVRFPKAYLPRARTV
jgi:acetamidase/formamidase